MEEAKMAETNALLTSKNIINVNWKVKTEELLTIEFRTGNSIESDEGYAYDLHRIFYWYNGQSTTEILFGNEEDYDVHEDVTNLFDLDEVSEWLLSQVSDLDNVTEAYNEYYENEENEHCDEDFIHFAAEDKQPNFQTDVMTIIDESEMRIIWLDTDNRMWLDMKSEGSRTELVHQAYNLALTLFAPQLIKQCPVCLTNELDLDEEMNAVSRKDDSTMICSDCGQAEAMDELFNTLKEDTK
jgi:hypothetical protein